MLRLRNTQKKIFVDIPRLTKDINTIRKVMKLEDWDLGVWCASNRTIQKQNLFYRKKNKATDILSIPFVEDAAPGKKLVSPLPGEKDLGDIILGMGVIHANSVLEKKKLEDFLPEILIHGMCHLIGYDHETDQDYKQMRNKERYILRKFLANRPE